MKMRLLLGTAALAFLSALGLFSAKPLLAQIRAALVKNIDERGRSPYQFHVFGNAHADFCEVSFPAAPAGKRLVAENLSVVANADAPRLAYLEEPNQALIFFNFSYIDGVKWVANPTVLSYFEGGVTPIVHLNLATGSCVMDATLTGYLVDLSQ